VKFPSKLPICGKGFSDPKQEQVFPTEALRMFRFLEALYLFPSLTKNNTYLMFLTWQSLSLNT
jgi:hypothetical protein